MIFKVFNCSTAECWDCVAKKWRDIKSFLLVYTNLFTGEREEIEIIPNPTQTQSSSTDHVVFVAKVQSRRGRNRIKSRWVHVCNIWTRLDFVPFHCEMHNICNLILQCDIRISDTLTAQSQYNTHSSDSIQSDFLASSQFSSSSSFTRVRSKTTLDSQNAICIRYSLFFCKSNFKYVYCKIKNFN